MRSSSQLGVSLVVKVELLKLHDINLLANTFKAQVWLTFVLKGGALDDDLAQPGVVFPKDANGAPTFRPSAGWFAAQLHFCNTTDACKPRVHRPAQGRRSGGEHQVGGRILGGI